MSTEKDVAREQSALPNDFRAHGPCMLCLRIWRMAEVTMEELPVILRKLKISRHAGSERWGNRNHLSKNKQTNKIKPTNQYPESRLCWLYPDSWYNSRLFFFDRWFRAFERKPCAPGARTGSPRHLPFGVNQMMDSSDVVHTVVVAQQALESGCLGLNPESSA